MATSLFAQQSDDLVSLRSILDICGLKVDESDVATIENNRVVALDLRNKEVSKDGIAVLPPEISRLSALKVLNCSGNIIETIPMEIGMLTDLQKLDMSSNRIVSLPYTVGNLTKLVNLDLRHNRIADLPTELELCKSLTVLQLWGNKLTTINEGVTRMPALEELYISNNRLTSLPQSIMKMNLRYIDFSGNKLCTLDAALAAWAKKKDAHFAETQKCW
jgi:Leucine-rich repeat (LRR) protein